MIRKILFVSRFMKGGGAERVIAVLSGALIEQGYEVAVMSYLITKEDYDIDFHVERYSMGSTYSEENGNAVTRTLFRKKRLKEVIKNYKPDIVFPFLEPVVKEVYSASRDFHIPIVATVRNLPRYHSKFQKRFYNYIYEHCEAVYFQTEAQKRYFTSKVIEKSFVLPNPVDISFIDSGSKRINRKSIENIVTAGRLSEQKNHKLLIDAMIIVHRFHPECSLKIYGEGEKRCELEAYVTAHNADDFVKMMGRTSELLEVYEASDLFVLSSDYEGMPNALAEAMAAAVPCISTDCPTGPRELLGDSERGILTKEGDADSLAKAMVQMIECPERTYQYGVRGHEYIKENLSPVHIAEKLIENCGRILNI